MKYIDLFLYNLSLKVAHRITVRHYSASLMMPISEPRDRFFYPHHTPKKDTYYPHHTSLTDTFSCISFDLPHLVFKVEFTIKYFKEFLLKFRDIDANSDRRLVLKVNV